MLEPEKLHALQSGVQLGTLELLGHHYRAGGTCLKPAALRPPDMPATT